MRPLGTFFHRYLFLFLAAVLAAGCAHYPVNQPLKQYNPEAGYRERFMGTPGNSDEMILYLAFSGGGTRAAAFSYGVLEELRDTRVTIKGRERRLLDEVDGISGVSGGSFTAGYFGLFGDRIFQDFETKFLKKNVNRALIARIFFDPINWFRLLSPTFDRSDLAAEYYDKHIFEGGTFGDIAKRKGPMILINATDMVLGIRIAFTQEMFDVLCSDITRFPVARAVAASSAVPVLLSPITIKNYSNSCGFTPPEFVKRTLSEHETFSRGYHLLQNIKPYMDSKKTPNIHLVDGGVSDNLGIRAFLDREFAIGNLWDAFKTAKKENVHKVVFIVVNAETEVSRKWSLFDKPPVISEMLKSYSSIAITRYNYETLLLLRESFNRWTEEVRKGRCGDGPVSTKPGACGDIKFYLIEVKFDALPDEDERLYFKQMPTSFKLSAEQEERLKDAAHRILRGSPEFQRLLRDLDKDSLQNR